MLCPLREMFLPPEVEFALEFLRATKRGDEQLAWAMFEQYAGLRPDSHLRVVTRSALEDAENVVIPLLACFLNHHMQRLQSRAETKRLYSSASCGPLDTVRRAPAQGVSGHYMLPNLYLLLPLLPLLLMSL
jgi:hypothetical protein